MSEIQIENLRIKIKTEINNRINIVLKLYVKGKFYFLYPATSSRKFVGVT